MRLADNVTQAASAIMAQPLRASLIVLAMSIGICAVTLLTALGESARSYVMHEFQALGTNLLIILPGRSETTGGQPPIFGETPRDLTLHDAEAISLSPHVAAIAPVSLGSAPVSALGLERETTVMGSTHALRQVRHLSLSMGKFIPTMAIDQSRPICVIGQTIKDELFAHQPVLGQWLRIHDRRFQIIGVLASEGQSIGVSLDELVIIPVASAQSLFNNYSLFRILIETNNKQAMQQAQRDVKRIIKLRHDGEEDITIITQDSVVQTFDDILVALTLTVASIASISLLVAGVLVMNVMLVSVTHRTGEIGLLKALGASKRQIILLFVSEAALLSLVGAVSGMLLGQLSLFGLQSIYPDFPIHLPLWAVLSALMVATITGLVFGVLPAYKAAKLDPVTALGKR